MQILLSLIQDFFLNVQRVIHQTKIFSNFLTVIDTYNKRQGGDDVTTPLRVRISGTTVARESKFGHGLLHI